MHCAGFAPSPYTRRGDATVRPSRYVADWEEMLSGRRMEASLVGAAAFAIFVVYVWSSNYWVDLTDEGYFLYLASRVHQGDLPYRDFDTYYTPGVFYLYATAYHLFGVSIMPVRVLMAAMRVICALLLYGLTRRVAPPPFAVLPFLVVAAVDPMPVFPEPHPSWTAMMATLLTLEAIVRHAETGRLRWVVAAGAAAGLAYAFKQNAGAFAALAVGGYLLFRPRPETGRLLAAARVLYALVLSAAVTVLLAPALDELVAAALWLPVLATLALLLWQSRAPLVGWAGGLRAALSECVLAGAAFVGVTLAWLVPLTIALGPRETPWGLFVGAVNQGALILPLERPPVATRELALVAIWLPVGIALLCRVLGSANAALLPITRLAGPALGISLLVPWMPVLTQLREPLVEDVSQYPVLTFLDNSFGTLYLYLPALAAWGALLLVAGSEYQAVGSRRVPASRSSRYPLLAAGGPLIPCFLLVGTLAALAIYPRSDTLHAMFAGPPLFVAGAWALWQVHRRLVGRAGLLPNAAMFLALLAVPAAAAAPHAYWRYSAITHSDPRAAEPPPYVEVGLERAPVLAPRHVADNVRGAVEFIQAGTAPNEPFFAYPAAPLFNFLADRPNPTRFDHYFPGALTAEDMVDVIRRLDGARPRYVLWDHAGVHYWVTNPTNLPLSDYIWSCYEQVANFPPYLILERRC
jgi:Dolichyl-phosphate-mannose-protein mannosyltransferase